MFLLVENSGFKNSNVSRRANGSSNSEGSLSNVKQTKSAVENLVQNVIVEIPICIKDLNDKEGELIRVPQQ